MRPLVHVMFDGQSSSLFNALVFLQCPRTNFSMGPFVFQFPKATSHIN